MKLIITISILVSLIGLGGCINFSNIVSTKIDNPELITKSSYPEYIKIVRKEPDSEIYKKIGEIVAKGESKVMIEDALRKKAASWGGDLLYLAVEPDTDAEETAGSTQHYQSTATPLYMKFVTAFVYKKVEK